MKKKSKWGLALGLVVLSPMGCSHNPETYSSRSPSQVSTGQATQAGASVSVTPSTGPVAVWTPPPPPKPITEKDEAAIGKAILAYAKPMIKTLSRDVKVYNWAAKSDVAPNYSGFLKPSDNASIKEYFGDLKGQFKHLPKGVWEEEGGGVYASLDPVSTEGYGFKSGDNYGWVLTQFTLPRGAVMLDTLNENSFPDALLAQVQAAGCPVGSVSALYSMAQINMGSAYDYPGVVKSPQMIAMIQTSDLQAANCLKLRNDFNAVVKIDFIRYGYNVVQLPSVCPNTRPGEAFVLISEKALNYAEMESFTSDIPTPDPYSEDRLLIESVFSNVPNPSLAYMPAGTSPYQTFQYPGFPWPTMSGTQPAENTAGWASKNWFNCGGGFAEDNAPFPAPTY